MQEGDAGRFLFLRSTAGQRLTLLYVKVSRAYPELRWDGFKLFWCATRKPTRYAGCSEAKHLDPSRHEFQEVGLSRQNTASTSHPAALPAAKS